MKKTKTSKSVSSNHSGKSTSSAGKSTSNSDKPTGNSDKGKTDSRKSANGAPQTDAIAFLKSQHRAVEALFVDLESETGTEEKMAVFKKIADQLTMHATLEEMYFYPAVRDQRTEDILLESVEDHLSVKRSLAELLRLRTVEEIFDAKLEVLQEQVEHHVAAEEDELFPKVERILDRSDLLSIGAAMQKKYMELVGTKSRERARVETRGAGSASV